MKSQNTYEVTTIWRNGVQRNCNTTVEPVEFFTKNWRSGWILRIRQNPSLLRRSAAPFSSILQVLTVMIKNERRYHDSCHSYQYITKSLKQRPLFFSPSSILLRLGFRSLFQVRNQGVGKPGIPPEIFKNILKDPKIMLHISMVEGPGPRRGRRPHVWIEYRTLR